jgi:DNA-binding transcriptional MocR family regulator
LLVARLQVRLRSGVDAAALAEFAEASHDVGFLAGDRCHPNAGSDDDDGQDDDDADEARDQKRHLRSWVRLCFAMLDESEITEGIRRLAAAIAAAP